MLPLMSDAVAAVTSSQPCVPATFRYSDRIIFVAFGMDCPLATIGLIAPASYLHETTIYSHFCMVHPPSVMGERADGQIIARLLGTTKATTGRTMTGREAV